MLTLNFDVPLYAQLCVGRWEFGRNGWAARYGSYKSKSTQPRSQRRCLALHVLYNQHLIIPWYEPVFRGRADGQSEGGVGVPVAVAVVVVPAAVARGPHEDAALAPPPRAHALHEGARGQPAGAVHRLAVVVRAPTDSERGQKFISVSVGYCDSVSVKFTVQYISDEMTMDNKKCLGMQVIEYPNQWT